MKRRRSGLRRAFFAAITLLGALLIVEIGLRLFVRPSDRSYGVLLGQELPPLELILYTLRCFYWRRGFRFLGKAAWRTLDSCKHIVRHPSEQHGGTRD